MLSFFFFFLLFGLYYQATALAPLPVHLNDGFCVNYRYGNLLYLGPAKTMTSMMARIHCEMGILKKKGHISKKIDRELDSSEGNFCFFDQQREMIAAATVGPLTGWAGQKRFLIWRDPLDRFLSIYGHMCKREHLCGKAGKNVHTFARGVYHILKSGSYPEGSKDHLRLKHHVLPQTWFCEISTHRKTDRVVEYTKNRSVLKKRLEKVFRSSNVPRWMWKKALRRVVHKESRVNQNSHEKYETWRQEILSNPKTFAYFKASYFHDYAMFGKRAPGLVRRRRNGKRRHW